MSLNRVSSANGPVYIDGVKVGRVTGVTAVPIYGDPPLGGHNHSINASTGIISGAVGQTTQWPRGRWWYYGNTVTTTTTNTAASDTVDVDTTTEEQEMEYIVGDGKTAAFTFQSTKDYPSVRVFTRSIEGEDEEKTITLEQADASVSIVQGENVTVTFTSAPSRRGAVVLIG